MVDRDGEMREISALLDGLDADGHGLALQIAGEPGIGKSRLLAQVCASARDRGHLVLSGRAAEFEGELPFGLFGDALDDWLVSLGTTRLGPIAGDLAPELAVVFPAFDALVSERPPSVQEERFRSYRAVRELLSTLATETPVVVVLDDVQWADPGSVELLCHLLAHPPRGPVLLALGFRPAQVSPIVRTALAAAMNGHGSVRLDLVALSAAGARELLGDGVSARLRDQLYRESGGNPFFLLQLARDGARTDRGPAPVTGDAASIPEPVRAALASELSSLSPPAGMLLQGAAVAGDPFDLELAASGANLGAADALSLVDELLSFELVFGTDVPGQFAFRHPIVRATVYEVAGRGWRAQAHARVLSALASRRAGAAAMAPHVERSGVMGDRDAIALLIAAGDESAPRAPALAARWYGAALRLMPESADAQAQRVALQIEMAKALGGSGQLATSHDVLGEVLARLPEDDPGRAPVVAFCAGVEHLLGRHRDARVRLTRAHELADHGSTAAVELMIELSAGGCHESRFDEMLRWGERARVEASRLGERPLEMVAAGQVALAHYFLGRSAAELTDRAAAAMDAIDDADLATRLDAGVWIGWTETVGERYDCAIRHCERLIAVARATGQGAFALLTVPAQVQALMFMGRLDEAERKIHEVVEAGRLAPNIFLSVGIGYASIIATYKGDFASALRGGEESMRLANTSDAGQVKGISGRYLAWPLIETGQAQRARDVLLASGGGTPALPDIPRSGRVHALEIMTRAELMLGDVDAAEQSAIRAVQATNGGELAIESAFAQRATAAVVLARGDAPQAAQLALDAAGRAGRAGGIGEAARSRILAARALVQADRRADAVSQLERAAHELARIGAHGYRVEAEALLRRLGRRIARRSSGVSSTPEVLRALSQTDQELAALVRLGHTNREIAATLFISEKTVERRLSRIFETVGVRNRSALASLIATDATVQDE